MTYNIEHIITDEQIGEIYDLLNVCREIAYKTHDYKTLSRINRVEISLMEHEVQPGHKEAV